MLKETLKISLVIVLISLTVEGFAGSEKKLKKTNVAGVYDENQFTGFDAVIYHTSVDSSTVYMNVHLKDFLYVQNATENTNIARFKVNYELFDSFDSKTAPDTASVLLFGYQELQIRN